MISSSKFCQSLPDDFTHGKIDWVLNLSGTGVYRNPIPGRDPAQKPLKIWAVWAVFQQDLSGLSDLGGLGGFFGKTAQTAQILLKKPLKNRSFLAVIFERFLKQDLSGFWAVFERSSRVEVPDSPPPPPATTYPPPPNVPPPPPTYPTPQRTPLQRTSNSSKRWGGTSTLVRSVGGGGWCAIL